MSIIELSLPHSKHLKLRKLYRDHEFIHGYCIALSDTIRILKRKLKESCKQESDIECEIEMLVNQNKECGDDNEQ